MISTVVCKKVHPTGSVWCKMALGEVGVSLPWWCHAFVLPAPGSWGLFLNLIILLPNSLKNTSNFTWILEICTDKCTYIQGIRILNFLDRNIFLIWFKEKVINKKVKKIWKMLLDCYADSVQFLKEILNLMNIRIMPDLPK